MALEQRQKTVYSFHTNHMYPFPCHVPSSGWKMGRWIRRIASIKTKMAALTGTFLHVMNGAATREQNLHGQHNFAIQALLAAAESNICKALLQIIGELRTPVPSKLIYQTGALAVLVAVAG